MDHDAIEIANAYEDLAKAGRHLLVVHGQSRFGPLDYPLPKNFVDECEKEAAKYRDFARP